MGNRYKIKDLEGLYFVTFSVVFRGSLGKEKVLCAARARQGGVLQHRGQLPEDEEDAARAVIAFKDSGALNA